MKDNLCSIGPVLTICWQQMCLQSMNTNNKSIQRTGVGNKSDKNWSPVCPPSSLTKGLQSSGTRGNAGEERTTF